MSISAQTISVKGVVKDAKTGETIVGANVILKGSTTGTVTDFNGNFSISAPSHGTLVVKYVGYSDAEIPISGKTNLIINISESAVALNEVVAIGYGQVKKNDLTGSVIAISADKLPKGLVTSMTDMMTGAMAGVDVITDGGAPGGAVSVRVRGGSSIYANNDPLYIVDGVPLTTGSLNGSANPLSFINPQDIETFTVLKDASATAIYGSRASNGVILITTKKGSLNSKKVSISYDGSSSVSTIAKEIDVMNANQYRSFIDSYYGATSTQAALLGNYNTNWQNQIFQTAVSQDHNLSFSGALGKVPFRISVGYTDQDGILKTTSYSRTTVGFNLTPSFFGDDLKVNLNAKGSYSVNSFGETGAIGSALAMDPTQPVYSTNGGYANPVTHSSYGNGYFMWMGTNDTPQSLGTTNPLSVLTQEQNDSWVYQSTGGAQFDYKVHWLPDLHAHLNLGYDASLSNGSKIIAANSPMTWTTWTSSNGSAVDAPYYEKKTTTLLDFYLNYNKKIGINAFDVTGGYSWQHFYDDQWNATYYATEPASSVPRTDAVGAYQLISFFGRANYTLLDKYLLTVTLRDDGSSRFASGNRWGLFPSTALAWKLKEESFLKNVDWLSDLKLRLGYGMTGQQEINATSTISTAFYPYLPTYTTSAAGSGAAYEFGNVWYQLIRPNSYNTSLKWETCTTYNLGLDFGFLNNRITGSLDAYKRVTNNLINNIPIAAGTNFGNYELTNIGNMENKGLEFSIGGKPIVTRDFNWTVNYNVSYNENKITKLVRSNDTDYPGITSGGINGGTGQTILIDQVGYAINSYYVYKQEYDSKGMPIEGAYANVGTTNNMYVSKHTGTPPVTMGFSSKMNYKNWFFNFALHSNIGNYNYNNVESSRDFYTNSYNSAGILQNMTPHIYDTKFAASQLQSDYYIQNASFVRLDNVSLGYTFDRMFHTKLQASLYGTVQNVFVITNYKGLDPELGGNAMGIDNNVYPRPRIFILGLRVNF
jgi:iron complex outermembrane receptor protein